MADVQIKVVSSALGEAVAQAFTCVGCGTHTDTRRLLIGYGGNRVAFCRGCAIKLAWDIDNWTGCMQPARFADAVEIDDE